MQFETPKIGKDVFRIWWGFIEMVYTWAPKSFKGNEVQEGLWFGGASGYALIQGCAVKGQASTWERSSAQRSHETLIPSPKPSVI